MENAFPSELGLTGAEMIPVDLGASAARVWQVRWPEREEAYLKRQPIGDTDSLAYDRDVLCWLKGRAPVPEVINYLERDGQQYLLMQSLPGHPASDEVFRVEADQTVRLLAESLKQLHAVAIDDCPFEMRLARRMALAQRRMELDLVEEDDFEAERRGRKAGDLYQELLATRPDGEDLVFCHGDACLPNFILFQGRVSGLIDIGRAGISDRWQDLALLLRSLRHNGYGDEALRLCLETYGEPPNPAKEAFYLLLDEFF